MQGITRYYKLQVSWYCKVKVLPEVGPGTLGEQPGWSVPIQAASTNFLQAQFWNLEYLEKKYPAPLFLKNVHLLY